MSLSLNLMKQMVCKRIAVSELRLERSKDSMEVARRGTTPFIYSYTSSLCIKEAVAMYLILSLSLFKRYVLNYYFISFITDFYYCNKMSSKSCKNNRLHS